MKFPFTPLTTLAIAAFAIYKERIDSPDDFFFFGTKQTCNSSDDDWSRSVTYGV